MVLAVSLFVPWWQLTVGDNILKVNASPVNTNFGLFGVPFTVPLLFALNLISILTLAASGVVMLFYSLMPTKPYSVHLLGFAYKKPLISIVAFLVGLVVTISVVAYFGINIPFFGSATVNLPANLTAGVSIAATVSTGFQLPFWLAIAAAVLCIAARLYHPRIAKKTAQQAPVVAVMSPVKGLLLCRDPPPPI